MTSTFADKRLFEVANRMINTGATHIRLPSSLLEGASREALEELRRLCEMNGVAIEVEGGR